MRRTMALRDFLQVKRVSLSTASPRATVLMPLANDFRLLLVGDPAGLTVLFRGTHELKTGVADPADTGALAAGDCSELSEFRPDSGWIPGQPSGVRLELTVGSAADVIVEYTSRTRPD
jgi:hypothetical protein